MPIKNVMSYDLYSVILQVMDVCAALVLLGVAIEMGKTSKKALVALLVLSFGFLLLVLVGSYHGGLP